MKLITVVALAGAGLAWPQAADYANKSYRTEEGRTKVAATLGAHDRDARQKPEELVAKLDLKPGMTVADIGTGIGYMIPYLAKAVGPSGKVLAEDIFPDFLDKARETAARKEVRTVEFIQGTERDPKLPANAVDVALILDAFHHFDFPKEMLAAIRQSLRANGRIAIVEFYKEGFRDPAHIRFTEKELLKEVEAAGFEVVSSGEFTPKSQYLAIFRKK